MCSNAFEWLLVLLLNDITATMITTTTTTINIIMIMCSGSSGLEIAHDVHSNSVRVHAYAYTRVHTHSSSWLEWSAYGSAYQYLDSFQTGSGQTGSSQKCGHSPWWTFTGNRGQNVATCGNILQNVATRAHLEQTMATCGHLWPFCEQLHLSRPVRKPVNYRAWSLVYYTIIL